MFGYIVMNKPEIKMKDFDVYRSFYCGLCRELREKYGISGQITLSYDMTFVIMLLSGLYEPKTYKGTTRCILHPVRKQPVRKNVMTEYCADMNILLTYYKCLDDWNDDRKYVKLGYARLLEGKNNRLLKLYPDKAKRIVELLDDFRFGETGRDRYRQNVRDFRAYYGGDSCLQAGCVGEKPSKNWLLSWQIHLSSGCI